ncbi:peptidylprolyl isomerase [bacterium]|nr:peptidylprolyl isomerase [bacterium]|tara:strand:+ start:419 stop:1756 length:1338 start_codon:yes stop_codon:yes gene_type:complete
MPLTRTHLLSALCAALLFAPGAALGAPELIDRIVATVDNQTILWSELNYRLRFEAEQRGLSSFVEPGRLEALRREVLEDMVDEQVLILKAQKDSVQIDPNEVEEMLVQQFQLAKSNMDDGEFERMLDRVGLSERQLKARYRKEIRHRLLSRQMRAVVAYRVHVSHRDVEAFRQAHRDTLPTQISLSHILLQIKPSDEVLGEKLARIGELQALLAAGGDFAEVARAHSEDPGSAAHGGDLGCFSAGTMVPEFEEAAFALKPGETSEPVLSPYGYHLIKLREKREDALCANHILVLARTGEGDKDATRDELLDLRRRARAGEEFSQLARQHSDNPQTAMQGGLWGSFPREQIPEFLQPYLRGLRLGEISEPFFLEEGGHIIRINDDQAALEGLIRESRTEEAMRELIEEYRQQIHIETRLDEDDLRRPGDDATGYLSEEHGAGQAAQ